MLSISGIMPLTSPCWTTWHSISNSFYQRILFLSYFALTCFNLDIFPYCLTTIHTFFSEAVVIPEICLWLSFPCHVWSHPTFPASCFYPPPQSHLPCWPCCRLVQHPQVLQLLLLRGSLHYSWRIKHIYSAHRLWDWETRGWYSLRASRQCTASQPGLQEKLKGDSACASLLQQLWSPLPQTHRILRTLKIPEPLLYHRWISTYFIGLQRNPEAKVIPILQVSVRKERTHRLDSPTIGNQILVKEGRVYFSV